MGSLFLRVIGAAVLAALFVAGASKVEGSGMAQTGFALENDFARYGVGGDGRPAHLIDRKTGADYCDGKAGVAFARVMKGAKAYDCDSVSGLKSRNTFALGFSGCGVTAVVRATAEKKWFTFEVVSVEGDGVEEITFAQMKLTLAGASSEPFAACALALNLKTNVPEIPGMNSLLRAMCYPRTGFVGAKAAVVACPTSRMRKVLQEVVSAAPELPHSAVGGPWALDAEINRGSYLFNFNNLTEGTVDEWIALAKSLGMNQIDFHGGTSFRFGDCRPNPTLYPRGRASLKAVIDKLHAAGIKAGLHTYAFFIDKSCPWVTPTPHPGLGKKASFTLAEDLAADAKAAPVVESTEKVSTVTGFFERNSVTVQIDDELIVFGGASKQAPYGFTECKRGACGTKPAAHTKGAKVEQLTECFGLFAPGGDSDLLAEVAAATAETYNECGFDMMYLDALDGEDVLGGPEYAWHYGSKFVFELAKRLKRPALMEMSTFHHHLWYARSRIGAMDYPTRSYKRFIDIHCGGDDRVVHCKGNEDAARMFLPAQLGWWSVQVGGDPQIERTYPDDIEYLMCKCLATNTGFALIGVDTQSLKDTPAYQRLAPIFRQYEELRHAGYFPESVREKLAEPGKDFTLEKTPAGKWQFREVDYARHKVTGTDNGSRTWTTRNPFGRQPLRLRIEALHSAGPYDSPEAVVLADPANAGEFTAYRSPDGVWEIREKKFATPLDLGNRQALGVWIEGDGKGEVIDFQVRSPHHLAWGSGDHLVRVDFTGRRYVEFVEPDSAGVLDYQWPFSGDLYGVFREKVNYSSIGSFSIYYNNLPKDGKVTSRIGPVRALPLAACKVVKPSVTIDGKTITFPVEIGSGCYLEFRSLADCKLYGPKGELLREVKSEGDLPELAAGENRVEFDCGPVEGPTPRCVVTIITQGGVLSR